MQWLVVWLEKSLMAFSSSAANVGKALAKSMLVATTAVVAFATKAVQAYAVQEKAEKELEAALKARGITSKSVVNQMKAMAAAIQDQTGAADEQTIATMAQLTALGVTTAQMEKAIKATIGLKSVGLQGATAQRAVATAMQGNFEMLQRYVPALRVATSEEEKAQIVNDLFRRGYEQQKDTLNTVAGRYEALKGRIGDLVENIGKAIANNGALANVLDIAGEKVKALGERIQEWIGSGGLARFIATVKVFFLDFSQRAEMSKNTTKVAFAAIADGGETAFNYLLNVLKSYFNTYKTTFAGIAEVAMATFNAIKKPSKESFKAIGDAAVDSSKKVVQSYKDLGAALAGETGIVSKRTESALADRAAMQAKHAQEMLALEKENTESLAKEFEKRAEDSAKQNEKEQADKIKAIEDANKKIEALMDERKNAEIEKQKQVIDDAKKNRDKLKKIANMQVKDFIDAQKKQEADENAQAKKARKFKELQARVDRGVKLGKRQQAELDAFNKIQAAKAALPQANQKVKDAQKKLEELQGKQLRELQDINKELANQNQKLNNLLALG